MWPEYLGNDEAQGDFLHVFFIWVMDKTGAADYAGRAGGCAMA
jgi:hypothetical protein